MSAGRMIAYIVSAILILFGILFILGAGGTGGGGWGWVGTGLILVLIAFVLIWFASRKKAAAAGDQALTLNIELPGNVSLDTLKCKSCGGALTSKNINMVAGAPVVTCPYCDTTYQLTEEPKW